MTSTKIQTPESRYRRGTFAAMAYYVVAITAATLVSDREILSGIWLYMLAAQPGAAIAIQLFVTLRYLRQADEFIRMLLAKRLIAASMVTFAILTVWGFLETFAEVDHLPGWWAYVMMWFFFGLSSVFIKDSK